MYNDKSLMPKAPYVTSLDATSAATAITLVNELKLKYNLLAKSYNQLLAEKVIE